MLHSLGLLIEHVFSRYRAKLIALVILMAIVAISEGIGMAMLLPLLNSIGVSGGVQSSFLQDSLDLLLATLGFGSSPYAIASLVMMIFTVQLALFLFQTFWIALWQREYCAYWQKLLLNSFLNAKWSFLSTLKLGAITNQISLETARISASFNILLQTLALGVTVFAYLLISAMISWQVTALMVLFAIFLFLVVSGIGKKTFLVGSKLGPLASNLNSILVEFLGALKLIKATVTEEKVKSQVGVVVDELKVQHIWASFLPSLVKAIFEFSSIVGFCALLVFGFSNLEVESASMLVIMALFVRLLPRFNALQQNIHLLGLYVPAFVEAKRMVAEADSFSERARLVLSSESTAKNVVGSNLAVDIRSAGYGSAVILRGVKINFPEVGLVGIVGESGSGKSTLLDCIIGMGDIYEGNISYKGLEIGSTPLDIWRRNIGYLSQDVKLFHSSIRSNITWGIQGNVADSKVISAAMNANALDFIENQPNGFDEILGDQGLRLSGGQRQRISIARALISDPQLLIMDEATSSLDSNSEEMIMESLKSLNKHKCIVMVAHRLSTLRKAKLIIVMDGGKVVEMGAWNDLIAKRGAFFKLLKSQDLSN